MHFRTDLLISPSCFYKKDTGIFAGPLLNLLVTTGKLAVFTMNMYCLAICVFLKKILSLVFYSF